jgi:hypothetical protein
VTATDLNGDAHVDIAVTNGHLASGTVSVLLGVGNGTFSPASDFATTAMVYSLAAGDFNNDGHVDFVTSHAPINGGVTVSILLGNGDGSFELTTSYDLDGGGIKVVAGDYDGDANLDVAVARIKVGVGTLDILSGLGDGTFSAPVHYSIPSFIVDAMGGDFNSDGYDDIAVSSGYGFVSVYLAQANGTFQSSLGYDGMVYYGYLAVTDLDSDSHTDIAVAGGLSSNDSGSIVVLMNDGNWPAPLPGGDGPGADFGTPFVDDATKPGNKVARVRPVVRYALVKRQESLREFGEV